MNHFDLLGKLERAESEPENTPLFHEVVREAILFLDLTCLDLATTFGMSQPSVRRWVNGRTAPHPAVRPKIYAHLIWRLTTSHSRRVPLTVVNPLTPKKD